jgi:AcrR family transcriptional regulator
MRKVDEARTEQQKRDIILAALACFSRQGIQGTTIDTICREAGISAGRLYYYFPSKDALLQAAIQYGLDETKANIANIAVAKSLSTAIIDVTKRTEDARREIGMSPGLRLEIIAHTERSKVLKTKIQTGTHDFRRNTVAALEKLHAAGNLPDDTDLEKLATAVDIIWSGVAVMRLIDKDFSLAAYDEALRALMSLGR